MTKIYKPLPEVHYRHLPDYLTIKKSELNINNEDVICTHGCTIGAFDENHLFYLQHRGLTYEEAVEVLVQAFSHKRTKRFYTHQNGKNII